MHANDWRRIVLCGFVAGTVSTLLSIVLVAAFGGELFAAIAERRPGGPAPGADPWLYLLGVAAGVWAMWLYAVIRPRSDSTVKTGVVVGLAWWTLASLQSLKWVVLLNIPASAWLPLLANAALTIAATVIGALLYEAAPPYQSFQATPDGAPERGR